MTEYQYIIDSTTLKARYDRICQIITALELQQVAAAANGDVESYSLDDGQTRINTVYRTPEAIAKAILMYERIKNSILDQLLGTRIVSLKDAKTIQSNGIYGL
jgi:hypothetical protein